MVSVCVFAARRWVLGQDGLGWCYDVARRELYTYVHCLQLPPLSCRSWGACTIVTSYSTGHVKELYNAYMAGVCTCVRMSVSAWDCLSVIMFIWLTPQKLPPATVQSPASKSMVPQCPAFHWSSTWVSTIWPKRNLGPKDTQVENHGFKVNLS